MNQILVLLSIFLTISPHTVVHGWDSEELEIFDLVEEVNQNFYHLLGINQDASLTEIKRAFRTLSVVLHPDKNSAEDANVQFRNLVAVYDVIKDASKREKYDKVLEDGLPNWKSALYYYRRMRKMSLAEGAAILFGIITVGQYLIAWASYIEKKYTAEQIFGNKIKKMQKKNKINVGIDTILNEIPRPSVKNTLPFQIPIGLYNLVVYGPSNLKNIMKEAAEKRKKEKERQQKEQEEEERQLKLEEERAREKENRQLRRRKQAENLPQKTAEELNKYQISAVKGGGGADGDTRSKPIVSGGLWTDDDLTELVRLVKKYPGGTANRWEVIADAMNRSVYEVTHMAAKLKESAYKVPGQESPAEQILQESTKKVKTRKTTDAVEGVWTQSQQQALESAIIKYPKSVTFDRWLKIADSVPGKTKDECLTRYKYLVELVKKQKEEAEMEKAKQEEEAKIQETPEPVEETVELVSKKSSKKKHKGSDEDNEMPIEAKGKAKNKRKERKKNIEYVSYEDYDDLEDSD